MNRERLRILVVEDELLIRWSITEALTQAGHDVAEAADAATAIRTLASGAPPDVVLLDLRLPDSNDLGLMKQVQRSSPHSAIVLMTAFGTPEVTSEAMDLGAAAVMHKPFDLDQVEPMLRQACDGRPH